MIGSHRGAGSGTRLSAKSGFHNPTVRQPYVLPTMGLHGVQGVGAGQEGAETTTPSNRTVAEDLLKPAVQPVARESKSKSAA